MLKQRFINSLFRTGGLVIIFFLLMPVCAFSNEAVKKTKDPIVVTSKILTIDSKNNTAVFENSVVAEMQEMTLYAEKMVVFYNKTTGHVTRVDASGGVKLVKKDSVVTADEATYYALDERVIFKGDLKVVDRENLVLGERERSGLDRDETLPDSDSSNSDLKK